jgi:hypothetical protein
MLRRSIAITFALICFGVPQETKADLISSSLAVDDPSGVTSAVLTLLNTGGGNKTLPIIGNVMGLVRGEAAAGATAATALLTELRPSAGPGVILTAGPPAVGGTVAYPLTTNPYSSIIGSATATTSGLIRGIPTGPGGGVINAVSVVSVTPTTATSTGLAFAAASATASTDPIVLAPLDSATQAMLDVNLLSNYPSDPTAEFSLTATSSGPTAAVAGAEFDLNVTTNIPGLSTLFDLSFEVDSNSSQVTVGFSSPVISQPILPSDFTVTSSGTYVLGTGKTDFEVPFTIPAGTLATDPMLGPEGLVLNVDQSTRVFAGTPEPGAITLLLTVCAGLALFGRKAAQ